ncbi:2OG-Fe(II) oxygenase [Rhizoctonia solani AG-1 IA]|uniref:2OG-Fe(II) oxygenase n=1 Tax=Thanatephorus cucumeris (strain AG1-IA) TaxID=983506 RepID=L8WMG2_THACA|nr:2OG-Fe(II) oxygenase [Rhizoctonia solani AG-1 IA]
MPIVKPRLQAQLEKPVFTSDFFMVRTINFYPGSRLSLLVVKNHGVDESVIRATVEAAHHFFDLSLEEKMKLDVHKSPNFKGYTPLLGENTNPENRGDLHECFDIGPEIDVSSNSSMSGSNVWPSEDLMPGFQQVRRNHTLTTSQEIIGLGLKLFPAFALALNLPEDFFADKVKTAAAIMRILHYPPQTGVVDDRVQGIGAHTELELLPMNHEISALQVLNTSGQWIDAKPIPGTFVINIADQLSRWTNDIFKSTVHRAINRSGVRRYSIPLFFGTDYDVKLEVLPSCISANRPARYEPIIAGDYVKSRLEETYPRMPKSMLWSLQRKRRAKCRTKAVTVTLVWVESSDSRSSDNDHVSWGWWSIKIDDGRLDGMFDILLFTEPLFGRSHLDDINRDRVGQDTGSSKNSRSMSSWMIHWSLPPEVVIACPPRGSGTIARQNYILSVSGEFLNLRLLIDRDFPDRHRPDGSEGPMELLGSRYLYPITSTRSIHWTPTLRSSTMLLEQVTSVSHTTVIAGLIAAIVFTVRQRWKRSNSLLPLPPGPPSYPVIEQLLSMPLSSEHTVFDKQGKEIKSDIISLSMLGNTIVVLNSAQSAIDLLEKKSYIYSDRVCPPMVLEPTLMDWRNYVALLPYGDRWREHRRMMHTWLQKGAAESFQPSQQRQARLLLVRLMDSDSPLDDQLYRTVAATLLRSVYGYELERLDDRFVAGAKQAIDNLARAAMSTNFLVNAFPALARVPDWFPWTQWKQIARSFREQKNSIMNETFQWTKDQIVCYSSNF